MEVATWWRRHLFWWMPQSTICRAWLSMCKGICWFWAKCVFTLFCSSCFLRLVGQFWVPVWYVWGRDFPHEFKMARSQNCWEHSNTSRILYRSSHTNFTYVSSSPRNMPYMRMPRLTRK
jgi:hypothetical protein